MLAPVDETTSPQTSTPEPGSAIGVVAAKFAERGLDVRVPGEQQNYAVTIFESGNTHCRVEVEDDAGVLVAYFMPIREAAPGDIAGMVRRFLSAGDDFPPGLAGRLYRDATLKGAVGREMNALGLKVCLDVIEDHDYYSVTAEVVVGNPVKPERGEVRLSDDTGPYPLRRTPGLAARFVGRARNGFDTPLIYAGVQGKLGSFRH